DALDANDWFFDEKGISKQEERQNDFGGTLGGPVVIPKLYNGKNNSFYFISYEGLRLREPQFSGIQDVPSIQFRQFVAAPIQPFLNSLPIPNGPQNGDQCVIPASSLSCTAQWSAGYSNPASFDAFGFRLDQAIRQSLRFFVRFSDTPSTST